MPLVQVPPRAVWGRAGQSMHTSAEHWLAQRPPSGAPAYPVPAASPVELAQLVTRYLVPTAPRPGEDAPAPVRLTAEFDNLVLSHAERSRVVSPEAASRLSTVNGVIPGAVLVDGFVAGMWRLARTREQATVTIEMFGPERERDALTAEAERVLAFAAPGADGSVRFAPLVTSP